MQTYTAGGIMDRSAALLNDRRKTTFTYEKQLPYLQIAWDEMKEHMEENNIQTTNKTDTQIVVPAGAVMVPPPIDLIEVQQLWERLNGSGDDFQRMTRVDFLPGFVTQLVELIYWTMDDQKFKFLGALSDRQLRIDYIRDIYPHPLAADSVIKVINAKTFLAYRTAGLCAEFIGENPSRAESLNYMAIAAVERFTQINTKARQSVGIRRRPFLSGWKSSGGYFSGI